MKTYTITESKAQLSALVEEVVQTGQPVVIGRAGKPLVQLVPYAAAPKGKRIGAYSGKIRISPDFDSWDIPEAEAFGMEEG
jgi:prevent-host-death family protein